MWDGGHRLGGLLEVEAAPVAGEAVVALEVDVRQQAVGLLGDQVCQRQHHRVDAVVLLLQHLRMLCCSAAVVIRCVCKV